MDTETVRKKIARKPKDTGWIHCRRIRNWPLPIGAFQAREPM